MLLPGDTVPDAHVWTEPRADPVTLSDAIAGEGLALLCFFVFDWSTG